MEKTKKTCKFFWFVGRKFLMHNLSMARLQVWLAWPIYVCIFFLWSDSKFDWPDPSMYVYFTYGPAPSLIDLAYLFLIYLLSGSKFDRPGYSFVYFIYGLAPIVIDLAYLYIFYQWFGPYLIVLACLHVFYLWSGSKCDWPCLSIYLLSMFRLLSFIVLAIYL